jgi:N-acetylglucosaminyl-diphospho-decaprenol L-rhamnosyltransferase
MISLLLVNFRSAALAAEAVRTARAATSSPLQVVAVDNSIDPVEQTLLSAFADVVIPSATNRGYAGGINLGRPACNGDVIIITNPDVKFAPQAIDLLAAELKDDVAVAGPALFWDDAHQWLLPPGDSHTTLEKLDQVLATRSMSWLEQRDRRRFFQRLRFWSLTETTRVKMLSGAVMAVRAADFDAVHGFDERFRLYFEETDFLRRIAQHRKRIVYVPSAKVRHMYNQSAAQVAGEAAAKYAESELRYLEKWSGPFMARLLKRLEKTPPSVETPERQGSGDILTEASPDPNFSTAAGHFGQADLPPEILATLKTTFYLRHISAATGEVFATVRISA